MLSAAAAPAAPVVVSLPTWQSTYDWPGGDGYFGWQSAVEAADSGAYAFGAPFAASPGLTTWLPGGRWYTPGAAEWRFDAPGTTRIASADLRVAYRDKLFAHHCLELGLRTNTGARDAHATCAPPTDDGSYAVRLADPASEPTAQQAYMRIHFPPCKNASGNGCPKWIPSLDPSGNAPLARVESAQLTLVDDDLPVAAASGPLFDHAGAYVNGNNAYDLAVSATDAGAGVKHVGVEREAGAELSGADASCDPGHHTASLAARICPPDQAANLSVPMQTVPEGSVSFQATGTDVAGNKGFSAPWSVLVDRTPPQPVSELEMEWDSDANQAVVIFAAEDDPDLPDGNPGSGVADYEYRFRHEGPGGWSEWRSTGETTEVPGSWVGEDVDVEVRSTDTVGNVSQTSSELLTVPDPSDADDGEEGASDESDDGTDSNDDDTASASSVRARAADVTPATITIAFDSSAASGASSGTTCATYPLTFFWLSKHNGNELRTTKPYPNATSGQRIVKFDPWHARLPYCRAGHYGTEDLGKVAGRKRGLSAQYYINKTRRALLSSTYQATMLDSLGQMIARIKRVKKCGSRTGDLFAITTRGGKQYCNAVSKVRMTIQGYGCILTSKTARKDWILFRYDGGDRSLQIRGFLWKAGLTRLVRDAITTVDGSDLPDTECDSSDKDLMHSTHDLQDPGFSGTDAYFRESIPPRTSPYRTYNFRVVKGGTTGKDIYYSYLLANTSAVKSGGIVRAVIPIESPSQEQAVLDQTDFMGYCDPNGAGKRDFGATPDVSVLPHVRWSYGELFYGGQEQNIEGWIPTAGLRATPPPASAPPGTPDVSPVIRDPKISDPDCDTEYDAPKVRATGYGYSN